MFVAIFILLILFHCIEIKGFNGLNQRILQVKTEENNFRINIECSNSENSLIITPEICENLKTNNNINSLTINIKQKSTESCSVSTLQIDFTIC